MTYPEPWLTKVEPFGRSAPVACLTRADIIAVCEREAAVHRGFRLLNLNLRALELAANDPDFAATLATADLLHVDGMPLVPLLRLGGLDIERCHRVTYADLLPDLLGHAMREGWRVCSVGGDEADAEHFSNWIGNIFRTLDYRAYPGYFETTEHAEQLAIEIASTDPDLLLLAMGMPLQERWLETHADVLRFGTALSVGAGLRFVTGLDEIPPRWSGEIGMEWMFRLRQDPARLGRRYLVGPWRVLSQLGRADVYDGAVADGS